MKKLTLASLIVVSAIASGCATPRYPLLSTPAVSMTQIGMEPGSKATEAGPVSSKFCVGDTAVASSKDDSNVGLMDEVIAKAQKETGARYIANAQFFAQGNCMLLEGTAMK